MKAVKKNKKPAGRPVKDVTKEVRAGIRFTKGEYVIIRNKASQAGITTSAYIRQTAINAEVKTRLTEEESHVVRQIAGMSNNFNQLAHNSYKEGMLRAMMYFEGYRNRLDDLLNKINHGE